MLCEKSGAKTSVTDKIKILHVIVETLLKVDTLSKFRQIDQIFLVIPSRSICKFLKRRHIIFCSYSSYLTSVLCQQLSLLPGVLWEYYIAFYFVRVRGYPDRHWLMFNRLLKVFTYPIHIYTNSRLNSTGNESNAHG